MSLGRDPTRIPVPAAGPSLGVFAKTSSHLKGQVAEAGVRRIFGQSGAQQLQTVLQAPRLDVSVGVTQRLRRHPLLGELASLDEVFDLGQTALDLGVLGPKLTQHGQGPAGAAEISTTNLFQRLALEGDLLTQKER